MAFNELTILKALLFYRRAYINSYLIPCFRDFFSDKTRKWLKLNKCFCCTFLSRITMLRRSINTLIHRNKHRNVPYMYT